MVVSKHGAGIPPRAARPPHPCGDVQGPPPMPLLGSEGTDLPSRIHRHRHGHRRQCGRWGGRGSASAWPGADPPPALCYVCGVIADGGGRGSVRLTSDPPTHRTPWSRFPLTTLYVLPPPPVTSVACRRCISGTTTCQMPSTLSTSTPSGGRPLGSWNAH